MVQLDTVLLPTGDGTGGSHAHTHSLYSLHSLYLSTDCNVINVLGRSCLSVRLSVTLSLSCALVGWLVGWVGGWVSFVVRSFIYLSMTVHTDNLVQRGNKQKYVRPP